MQFTLVNDAVFVRVQELDGVFYGEHVIKLLFIDFVDDGRQGRRFARAGWAGYQHDSVAQIHNFFQLGGQVQGFVGWDLTGNHAHHDGTGAALHEDVDPKPIGTRQTVGHITGTERLQVIDRQLVVADQIGCNATRVLTGEGSGRAGGDKLSRYFDEWRLAGRKKQIADLRRSLQHCRQQRRSRKGSWGGSNGGGCPRSGRNWARHIRNRRHRGGGAFRIRLNDKKLIRTSDGGGLRDFETLRHRLRINTGSAAWKITEDHS